METAKDKTSAAALTGNCCHGQVIKKLRQVCKEQKIRSRPKRNRSELHNLDRDINASELQMASAIGDTVVVRNIVVLSNTFPKNERRPSRSDCRVDRFSTLIY